MDDHEREIYRHVNSGGSFGANPLRQTLGIGHATRIDRLEIRWPKSGETQAFEDVAVERLVRIVEGAAEPVPLILSRTKSGG